MSWREILGVARSENPSSTHNSQNTQKPVVLGNCADIADCAYRKSNSETDELEAALVDACDGLKITPEEIREALAPEDLEDWRKGLINTYTLTAFARSLILRREMDRGKRPEHYTEKANCKQCGPIWLWFAGEVLGCPWCWNRLSGRPIPRPDPVRCSDW